jgi:hypothetical protein
MPDWDNHGTYKYTYQRSGTIYNVRPVSGYYESGCDPWFVLGLAVVMKAVDDIRLDNRHATSAKIFFEKWGISLLMMLGIGPEEMSRVLSDVGFECDFDDLILSQSPSPKWQIKAKSL